MGRISNPVAQTAETLAGIIEPFGFGVSIEFVYQTIQTPPGFVLLKMAGLSGILSLSVLSKNRHWMRPVLIMVFRGCFV